MADISSDKRKAAVQSMFRVRASESPPGPDGLRTVWHQGGEGADLTSIVDPQGRVVRQEFVLFGDQLLWVAETGVSTGKIQDGKAAGEIKGSTLVSKDAELDSAALARMNEALAGFTGEDKYLQHLAKVVGNVLAGLNDFAATEVTRGASGAKLPSLAQLEGKPSPPASRLPIVLGVVGGAIVLVIALVLLLR